MLFFIYVFVKRLGHASKPKVRILHTTLSLKLDSAAGRYRLYRVLYTYFLIRQMWQPSATDFYAHQAAAGMACLVLANELFLAVKRVSLLGNKRRNTGCCQY